MDIIDKCEFIRKLSNETVLSVDEATELINKIPLTHLEMAVSEYNNNGLLSLKMFAEVSKFLH